MNVERFFVAVLVVGLAGCAASRAIVPIGGGGGVSDDVPEQALRELAAQIEGAVERGERDHGITDYEGIIVSTPEINQAIRTRAARREVLDEFLNTGFGWERMDGLVHVIRNSAYKKSGTNQSRNRDALIVISENDDRWTLYEGLVDANKYGRGALNQIRTIFYEARIATLEPGQTFENSAGEPVIK